MRFFLPLTYRKGDYVDIKGRPVKRAATGINVEVKRGRAGIGNAPQLMIRLTYIRPVDVKITKWRKR